MDSHGDLFIANPPIGFPEFPTQTVPPALPSGVLELKPDGTLVNVLSPHLEPDGIAVDRQDNLYAGVGDIPRGIVKITPDGVNSTVISGSGFAVGSLVADSQGNVITSGFFTLAKITPGGQAILLSHPFSGNLAIDHTDTLFVAAGTGAFKVSPSGLISAFSNVQIDHIATIVPEPNTATLVWIAAAMIFAFRLCKARRGRFDPKRNSDNVRAAHFGVLSHVGPESLECRAMLSGIGNIPVNDLADGITSQTWGLQNTSASIAFSTTASGIADTVVTAFDRGIVALNAVGKPVEDPNSRVVHWSVSTNAGSPTPTFVEKGGLPDKPGTPLNESNSGQPAIGRFAGDGTIYLAARQDPTTLFGGPAQLNVFKSADNGQSFTFLASALTDMTEQPPHDGQDENTLFYPSLAVDNGPSGGANYSGSVYVAAQLENPDPQIGGEEVADIGVSFLRPGGTPQFSPVVVIPVAHSYPPQPTLYDSSFIGGPWITVGSDHTVYVTWVDGNHFDATPRSRILMMASTDGGVSFHTPGVPGGTTPATVASVNLNILGGQLPISGPDAQGWPQVLVNPSNPLQLFAVYGDSLTAETNPLDPMYNNNIANVFFTQSIDGGQTWSPKLQLNDNATSDNATADNGRIENAQSYQPAMSITPDGTTACKSMACNLGYTGPRLLRRAA